MSERTESDIQPTGSQELARVLICVGGPYRDIVQDYKGKAVDIMFSDDFDCGPPAMFNQMASRSSYDLIVFMNEDYDFADETCLGQMVDYFWSEKCQDVGAMYTDALIFHDKLYVCTKFNPTFNHSLKQERMMLNIPFICKYAAIPKFDERLKELYLWDGILWLMKNTLLHHIPKPLFSVTNAQSRHDLKNEVALIHDTHYKSNHRSVN